MVRREFLALAAASASAAQDSPIAKAMNAVRSAVSRAEADPWRPAYHFRPPASWNNDPNGTIFHNGWHHLFYQHNPYEARWGHMHWGHARSRDLVNWEHLPIALWPSLEKGEEHVYSGGAIHGPDGRPWLFYTSIGKRDPEQWLALPGDDDLITWRKSPSNPVLGMAVHGGRPAIDWRDPFLFREGGRVFMVTGGNLGPEGGRAVVQMYRADNAELTSWKYLGPVFRHPDRAVRNIECPNLFRLDGRWVLLVSPHRPVEYFAGDLDVERPRFVPETHGVLDAGNSYASNVSFDGRGRAILWLWARTETPPERGWNSAMALPRLLSVGPDGHLRQSPVPELASLRQEPRRAGPRTIEGGYQTGFREDTAELHAVLEGAGAREFGLRAAGVEIEFSPRSGILTAGKASSFAGRGNRLSLRVFLDRRIVEIYANDGAAAMLVLAETGSGGIEFFTRGGAARLLSLDYWPMRPARFSLEKYTPPA